MGERGVEDKAVKGWVLVVVMCLTGIAIEDTWNERTRRHIMVETSS